jgi:hypothetical protein
MDDRLEVIAPGVLENDSDPDGDAIKAVLVDGVREGSLTLNPDGSLVYSPREGFIGEDGFSYRANDGRESSQVVNVTISVTLVNEAPQAVDDAYMVEEDEALVISPPGVLANDLDADGDQLAANLVGGPTQGTLAFNNDGSLTYTPASDFNGVDSFTYRANDGYADSDVATVSITINAVNDVPEAREDQATTQESMAVEIDILENDLGLGDTPLVLEILAPAAHGQIEVVEGEIIYTPESGFIGEDLFEYRVIDADGEIAEGRVTVLVKEVIIES